MTRCRTSTTTWCMPRQTPCSTTVARSKTLRVPRSTLRCSRGHDCAKILAQVGVGEVVYLDKYADTDDGRISRRILDSCGISYRQVIADVQIGIGGTGSAVICVVAI